MRHNSHLSSEFILKNTNRYMNYLTCSLLFESISELIILTVKNKDLEKSEKYITHASKLKLPRIYLTNCQSIKNTLINT